MSSIDERVVRMEFDNDKFEAGVRTTMTSLEKLKESLNFKSGAFNNVQKSADSLNLSPISNGIYQVQQNFSMLGEFTKVLFDRIANRAIDLGRNLVSALTIAPIRDGFAEYETQMNAVQTIMANTKKEFAGVTEDVQLDAINGALNELNHYADRTIYNFTEMTRNIGTFTAAGVGLDDSVSAIQGIANLAAVSGANAHQASNAMYQLSQALSSGVVRLMDWRSVQNASMGGQFFQDALQKTADEFIETGRQVENAAGQMVSYSDATGITTASVEDLIAQEGSFSNSLQKGWLTSDVLLETLAKFTDVGLADYFARVTGVEEDWIKTQFDAIDAADDQDAAIDKLAKTLAETGQISEDVAKGYIEQMFLAQDAATEVKTFTQLIDTLKEALGSGWTQSMQYIVGDFKEAIELWTAVNNELSAIIDNISETRNAILKLWHDSDAVGSGGRVDALQAVADVYFGIKAAVLSAKETFEDFFGSPTIEESAEKLMALTRGFSRFAGSFREFLESNEFTARLQGILSGVFSVAKAFLDIAGRILNRLKPLMDGISQFAWYIFSAADSLGRLISYFVEADDKFAFLKNIFTDGASESRLFSRILTELGFALEAVLSSILGVFGLDISGTPVVDFFNSLTGFLRQHINLSVLDALIDKLPTISDIFDGLKAAISGLADVVSTVFDALMAIVKAPFEKLSELFGGRSIGSSIDFGFFDAVGAVFDTLGAVFSNFFGVVTTIGPKIGSAIRAMFSYLASEEFGRLAQNFTTLMGGGFLGSLKGLVDAFKNNKYGGEKKSLVDTITGAVDALKEAIGFDDITEKFTGALDALTSSFTNLQNAINSTAILKIAIAVALLAGSLVALSKVDPAGMANGIAGLTTMLGELVGAFTLLSSATVGSNPAAMAQASSSMIKMSIAVGIMALALKSLSGLSMDQMAVGLVGIAGMLFTMAGVAVLLSAAENDIKKTATGILVMSIAMRILVTSVKYLSDLDWESLGRGLAGVAGLLVGVAVFSNLVNGASVSARSALSVIAVAIAVRLLANTVNDFSGMDWESLARGLTGVGVMIVAIGAFMRIANKTSMSVTALASILVLVAAVRLLSDVVQVFAGMNTSSLEQGIVSVGLVILALGAVVAVVSRSPVSIADVVGIFVVAQAVRILSEVVQALGRMGGGSLDRGLIGLAGAVAGLVVPLALVGKNAGSMLVGAAAMLVMAGAIRAVVPAIIALGTADSGTVIHGILSLVAALAVVGAGSLVLAAIAPSIFLASAAITAFGIACAAVGAGILLVSAGITALGVSLAAGAGGIVAGLGVLATGLQSVIVALIVGLFTGIARGVEALLYGVADILAALDVAIHAIGEHIIANIPYVLSVVGTMAIGVFALLQSLIPTFISTVGSFVIALLQALVTWIPAIADALLTAVVTLINSVADGIRAHGPEIISAVGNIIGSIIDLVLLGIEEILRMIPGVGDMLGDQVENARGAISEAFSAGDLQQTMQDSMAGAQQGVENGSGAVVDAAKQIGPEVNTAIEDGLGDGAEITGPYVDELVSGLSLDGADLSSFTGSLSDTLTFDLSGAADSTVDSYISSFNVDASALPIAGVPEDLVGILGSFDSNFSSTGDASASAYTNAIGSQTALSNASSSGSSVASSGVSGMDSKRSSFNTSGYYSGVGYGNGMSSASGYVNRMAANLAASALATINRTMQIASPSKVTMKSGRFAGEGLGIGMSQMVPYVESQASRLGGGAMDGLRESIKHVGDILSADMDFEPTIRPVLDLSEIQNGASAIGGMIGSGSYGMTARITPGAYAFNSMSNISGRRPLDSVGQTINVNLNGVRVNDVPEIRNATYDFLMTLKRYGDM